MSYTLRWFLAFALTQSVEMGVYVHAHDEPRPLRERLAVAFAASAISHPLVWFVIPELTFERVGGWWTTVAIAETFAVLSEATLLWAFAVRAPLVWALLANTASFVTGLFLYAFFPDW